MKDRRILIGVLSLGLLFALLVGLSVTQAQVSEPQGELGTAFTYQGKLEANDSPISSSCDFRFILYDAEIGGSQVGPLQERTGVDVAGGLFIVPDLDFGTDAFTGDARWLEIAVQCAGDSSYTTLGRQALTAAPQALYALGAPWSGLSGMPAGFADGVDDVAAVVSGTNIFAGEGLTQLSSGNSVTLSVVFAGSGSATTVSRFDHDHLGQTWSSSNNPLKINGSFGNPDYAPLVLSNSSGSGDGLRVNSAGDDGVHVTSAGGDGVYVAESDRDGLNVDSAGRDGVYVHSAVRDGFTVFSAGSDGVYVGGVGNFSTYDYSGEQHGFEVGGAEGSGLRVGRADDDGVHVHSAGDNGIEVAGAEHSGVLVGSALHGVYVDSADKGVFVREAGTGVQVMLASWNGMYVHWASRNGVYVLGAGWDGVRVLGADYNGVYAGTDETNHEWGFNTPDKIRAGTTLVSGGPLMFVAQNSGAGELEPGDVVAAAGLGVPFADSPSLVTLVQRADLARGAGVVGVVYSRFVAEEEVEEIEHEGEVERHTSWRTHSTEGTIAPGEYLLIVVLGTCEVKVDAVGGSISPGDALTLSSTQGRATRAQPLTLDGVSFYPPGVTFGTALASLDAAQDTGTIPVFVNLP